MITVKKLKTFKGYNGDISLFIRGHWYLIDRTTVNEFRRIEELLKEARMLQKDDISLDSAELLRRKIEQECKNQKAIDFLYELAQDDKYFLPGWHPAAAN